MVGVDWPIYGHGRTDGRTDGQRENNIPPTNKVCGEYVSAKYQIVPSKAVVGVDRPMKAPSMHIQKPY